MPVTWLPRRSLDVTARDRYPKHQQSSCLFRQEVDMRSADYVTVNRRLRDGLINEN